MPYLFSAVYLKFEFIFVPQGKYLFLNAGASVRSSQARGIPSLSGLIFNNQFFQHLDRDGWTRKFLKSVMFEPVIFSFVKLLVSPQGERRRFPDTLCIVVLSGHSVSWRFTDFVRRCIPASHQPSTSLFAEDLRIGVQAGSSESSADLWQLFIRSYALERKTGLEPFVKQPLVENLIIVGRLLRTTKKAPLGSGAFNCFILQNRIIVQVLPVQQEQLLLSQVQLLLKVQPDYHPEPDQ